jgi:hypothetical protein
LAQRHCHVSACQIPIPFSNSFSSGSLTYLPSPVVFTNESDWLRRLLASHHSSFGLINIRSRSSQSPLHPQPLSPPSTPIPRTNHVLPHASQPRHGPFPPSHEHSLQIRLNKSLQYRTRIRDPCPVLHTRLPQQSSKEMETPASKRAGQGTRDIS